MMVAKLFKAASLLALVGSVLLPTAVLAQTAAPAAPAAPQPAAQPVDTARVLIINTQRIFDESAAGQDAQRQLTQQRERLEARVKTLQEQFKKESEALEKKRGIIAQEALQKEAADFEARASRADADVNKEQNDLRNAAAFVQKQIVDGIRPIVADLMLQRGANIALDRGQTFLNLASDSLDITNIIIQRLNQSLPKVSTTPPAASAAPATPAAPKPAPAPKR
jgi:outer membrane protein